MPFSRLFVVWVFSLGIAIPQELTWEKFDHWLEHVRPKPVENEWLGVPWRATLWDAVIEAKRRDRPILLWAMNGHPLACV